MSDAINDATVAFEVGSLMNDAVYQIVTKDFAFIKGRKAIIVLTDGFVWGEVSNKNFLDTLIESDTPIYPIFFQTRGIFPSKIKTVTMDELVKKSPVDFLNTIAISTGGRLYAADADNFSGVFQKIADELKKQYLIGFYPKDGKSNNITIKVDRPDVVIRTKQTIRLKTPNSEK